MTLSDEQIFSHSSSDELIVRIIVYINSVYIMQLVTIFSICVCVIIAACWKECNQISKKVFRMLPKVMIIIMCGILNFVKITRKYILQADLWNANGTFIVRWTQLYLWAKKYFGFKTVSLFSCQFLFLPDQEKKTLFLE